MQGSWVKVGDPADASLWVARGLWLSRLAGLKVGLGDSGFKLHFSDLHLRFDCCYIARHVQLLHAYQ